MNARQVETDRLRAEQDLPFGQGARRLHSRTALTPLEHQIIYRPSIRLRLSRLDQPCSRCVLFNVMPFFCIIFSGSKVPIEIFRLPDGRLNGERSRNRSRTYALPHLHPICHALRTDFRSGKKMYVIRHDNIIAHPPAVLISRALPDFTERLLAMRRSKNFASLISARCKEDNRVVAERRYMRQVAKWG